MIDGANNVASELRTLAECAQAGPPLTFMEVCGTHTMSAFRTGLHSLLPENVRLLSGPGCPVCVTSQGDIDGMIALALDRDVRVCTYGDMLRVPGRRGSLEQARSQGADVRVVYSAMDAVAQAESQPSREVVLAAVGFETTAPATAAAVLRASERGLTNFSILSSHKRVLPAVLALLEGGEVRLDGLLCPGHVSVIVGADYYRVIVERYGMPCVIAGFEDALMASALAQLARMARSQRPALVNQYPEAVTAAGNAVARRILDEVFEPAAARWRGLGEIPESGLAMRANYQRFDAASRFALPTLPDRPARGCVCGAVITGAATPADCTLFGDACTPIHPLGPCMVSSEGTCQAWFKYHQHRRPSAVAKYTEFSAVPEKVTP